MRRGGEQEERAAEETYQKILPAIVFTLQSLDTLICYGKRIAALRLGLAEVHDRAPALGADRLRPELRRAATPRCWAGWPDAGATFQLVIVREASPAPGSAGGCSWAAWPPGEWS